MAGILGEIGLSEQLVLSYIIGIAGAPAVYPYVRSLENAAWSAHAVMPPDAETLAAGVAQGQVDPKQAAAWAKETGFDTSQFKALIDIANTGPPIASALTLLRRKVWTPEQYKTALNRLAIESQWYDGLTSLEDVWLTPAELAVMVQRNVVPNDGLLPNQPSTANSDVPPMPMAQIDTLKEAAGAGINAERLGALAKIIGLPASPDLAARMHYRKIINLDAYNLAIKEGNTRGEWASFLLDGFREIPTAEQFVEAHLRGWITQAEMYAGTALHGMSQPDTDLEYQIHRRPLTPHAIKQALARGAKFNPEAGEIADPYTASVHQANLGPEWYEMGVALQGSYPSLFITNRLVTSGIITPADGQSWLERAGTADEVVTALGKSWGVTAGGSGDPHVAKAATQLWGTTHSAYKATEIGKTDAQKNLTVLGLDAAASQQVFTYWDAERATVRHQISVAQLLKAEKDGITNPATGQAYTNSDVVTALVDRGYSQSDATVLASE